MERRSVASEKSKTAKEVANKRLREDLAAKNELVDAQSAKITELNKLVAVYVVFFWWFCLLLTYKLCVCD